MTEFTVKLADIPLRIRTIHPELRHFLRDWLSAEEPELSLEMQPADMERERRLDAENRALEGLPPSRSSDCNLEMLAVYRKLAEELVERDILLFHGSALSMDGKGYILTAPSGTGKSTHARLWREHFGERVTMVNDDKPFLKIADDGVTVYGSPWSGKHRLDTNTSVPLHAIAVIERAKENSIERMSPLDAVAVLLQQAYREEEMEGIVPLALKLAEMIPVYKLHCNMEPEAAEIAYEGMVLNDL